MGLVNDKRDIYTTIGAYTAFIEQNQLPKLTDLYPSVNNKKDVIPFLLDTLKIVAGTEALKELMGKTFSELLETVETGMKVGLKKQFTQYNSNLTLSPNFTSGSGIIVNVSDIDPKGKLKISPSSEEGNLLFDNINDNFDSTAYDAILNAGVDTPFAGKNLILNYTALDDTMRIRPQSDQTIGDFFNDYIDDVDFINNNELTTYIIDKLFGTLSKSTNKTSNEILEDLKLDQILDQIKNQDTNPLIIKDVDLFYLENKARQIASGVTYSNLGCGQLESTLAFSGLTSLVSDISGSTDFNYIGNRIEETLDSSISSEHSAVLDKNKTTINDNFFQKFMDSLINEVVKIFISSPQVRMLFSVMSALQNDGTVLLTNILNDMESLLVVIKCIIKDLEKIIAEFIFKLVLTYLTKLITPVIERVIREKIKQYVDTLKSLLPASNLI